MDQKKVIEKLLKIAENQQKIIMKLAQATPPAATPTGEVSTFTPGQAAPAPSAPPPQSMKPVAPKHEDLQAMILAANPKLGDVIASIAHSGPGVVNVSFKPGQATQPNYDAVLAAVQKAGVQAKVHVV